jgi:methyl coenzyme M reductase alpha subunit
MKNLLLTVLAFGLLSSSAFAEEQPRPGLDKKQFTRVVASGANQRIGFFYALNPDCTASGNVNVRATKQPEHGTVEITTVNNFPDYPKESLHYKCNQHRVKGMQINYKSAEKYVGDDALDLLILWPAGTAWEVRFDVSVR